MARRCRGHGGAVEFDQAYSGVAVVGGVEAGDGVGAQAAALEAVFDLDVPAGDGAGVVAYARGGGDGVGGQAAAQRGLAGRGARSVRGTGRGDSGLPGPGEMPDVGAPVTHSGDQAALFLGEGDAAQVGGVVLVWSGVSSSRSWASVATRTQPRAARTRPRNTTAPATPSPDGDFGRDSCRGTGRRRSGMACSSTHGAPPLGAPCVGECTHPPRPLSVQRCDQHRYVRSKHRQTPDKEVR